MADAPTNIAYRWTPIQRLDVISCGYDFSEIDSLQRQWVSIRKRREESNPHAYNAFLERLDRSWAIETGIIEGLYTLDKGVTETLVQRGFNAELIDYNATNKDPEDLVRVLEDHQQAAEGVYHYIREGRPLSKTLIRSLHVTLTQHQPTYTAYDQFGKRFETPLDRGGFKTLPNNPTRPDGRIHEYCPPVQVDSEIDNLVEWHGKHRSENYHPLLIAAWLHHTFSQIHPFQDGNGRVARALLTWHLVREGYLSVVISRDDRPAYIDALETADHGNFDGFVNFLVQLEKRTIMEALDEPEPVTASGNVEQVIGHIVEQVKRRNQERQSQMRSVNELANMLRNEATSSLESWASRICMPLRDAGIHVEWVVRRGGPGERETWYEQQTLQSAKSGQYQVNRNESKFFAELSIEPDDQSLIPRFVFVVSLHHVGRQLTGVMTASTFGEIGNSAELKSRDSRQWSEIYFIDGTNGPFTFTWQDGAEEVAPRFTTWIEKQLEKALRHWSEFISE